MYLVSVLGDGNSVYLVKSELWWNYVLEMPMALFHSDYVMNSKEMSLFEFQNENKMTIF